MAVKSKTGTASIQRKEPICKRTRQGAGRGSRPKCGKKAYRGQGR
jgi:hypothetical protein